MNLQSRIRQIKTIVEAYLKQCENPAMFLPLSVFLSNYYRVNKQMGSRDRKIVSELVYNYFRVGSSLGAYSFEDKLLIGNFLCQKQNESIFSFLFQGSFFEAKLELPLEEKLASIKEAYSDFSLQGFLGVDADFSQGINLQEYLDSFFSKPLLWIRVKKGKEQVVKQDLQANELLYQEYADFPQALSFSNGTALENLSSKKNAYFEIQDLSSQRTGNYFHAKPDEYWWDCCAASGGKSLLLFDMQPGVKLLASDNRAAILSNLKNRFKASGIRDYELMQLDLQAGGAIHKPQACFDGIIADVPCSGSGTWARTPEMLSFFTQKNLHDFQERQKAIAGNVVPYLKPGQALIYITCSVFKAENEHVVSFLCEKFDLALDTMQLINGCSLGADSMFVARLIKKAV
jgi:16S rRNA (cytosine967-C5)-methyltransferase